PPRRDNHTASASTATHPASQLSPNRGRGAWSAPCLQGPAPIPTSRSAMNSSLDSLLLTNLSWTEVRDRLAQDGRLIVPLGACDQYGPHLPIGAATLVTEAFARQLSTDL